MSENSNEEQHLKPSFKEAKRRHDLYFKGCVLRTISSIANATLTRQQEDVWLEQLKAEEQVNKVITDPELVLKNANIQETIHKISSDTIDRLVDIITTLALDASTPVGENLSKLETKWGVLSSDMITMSHYLGSKVAILTSDGNLNGHIYHIAPTLEGGFISLSDANQPVALEKDQYLCLVFIPKKTDK